MQTKKVKFQPGAIRRDFWSIVSNQLPITSSDVREMEISGYLAPRRAGLGEERSSAFRYIASNTHHNLVKIFKGDRFDSPSIYEDLPDLRVSAYSKARSGPEVLPRCQATNKSQVAP